MKISTKGRYAVRIMIDLAQHKDEIISNKEIADRQNIPIKYLEQIVNTLTRSGLLKSLRGAQGGHVLVKNAEEYTIAEILRVTEGSLAPVACLDCSQNVCPRKKDCISLTCWTKLNTLINDYLESVTLQQLIDEHSENFYEI